MRNAVPRFSTSIGGAREIPRPARPRDLKGAIPDAPKILLHNVHGWFVRVERGVYSLSEAGKAAIILWKADLPEPAADLPGEPKKIAVLA
jgi:hypothetical protein